jgi:hypothetical protein
LTGTPEGVPPPRGLLRDGILLSPVCYTPSFLSSFALISTVTISEQTREPIDVPTTPIPVLPLLVSSQNNVPVPPLLGPELYQILPSYTKVSAASEPPFTPRTPLAIFATKKKYKPVALKVRPITTDLPERFRILRNITGDPLAMLPTLPTNPLPFTPSGRYTLERKLFIDEVHSGDFLWPSERDLLHRVMIMHQDAFAWSDSERGHFREEFFPPVEIPTVPHKPWVMRNIPIPPGIYNDVCAVIRRKIDAGVFEPSNSSYRSRWFCVVKKDGSSLRMVQSLEPLNAVTIAHSGVPPYTEQLVEQFAGRACGAMLDLFVGYDERALAEVSRDFTTFQTPFGALRLTTLPMGWTNSVPIFHDDVTHILQPEIPHLTVPYIDDVPIKGPRTDYRNEDGTYETITENPGIRRFVWEHFQGVNRVLQRMKYSGGTFSGFKSVLCAREITVLGHRCTPEGRLPDPTRVAKISNWGELFDLSDVRAFIGTMGVCRMFIRNFAHRAHHLVKLTRNNIPFEYGPEQVSAQNDLKEALLSSPALRPIDYTNGSPVILSVDTSYIAVGYILGQCDLETPKLRYFARFGSITLNEREARFSQPKLELYGLYRTLRTLRLYLIGLRNLVVEMDAKFIKGMLANPDIAPSASINRWIVSILMFKFELVHVPGAFHGPDGLSRRRPQPGDYAEPEDDFDDWIDQVNGFPHMILSTSTRIHEQPPSTIYIFTSSLVQSTSDAEQDTYDRTHNYQQAPDPYAIVPRSADAKKADDRTLLVQAWHEDLQRPDKLSDAQYETFLRYCTEFFLVSGKLWRKDRKGEHKLVVAQDRRVFIMASAHDDAGHHGYFATHSHIALRYWWPFMGNDLAWFIRTCHLCQIRKTQNVLIPPVVATPAPLFAKIYVDTMHLPKSGIYKFIVQGRCSIAHWAEFDMLRQETARAIGEWLLKCFIYRWGTLLEIVSDNGAPFVKAIEYLSQRYHINHIRISGYNSRANGLVERTHFDVRQALFKAADGDQTKWSQVAYSVFWADRITVRKRMGCSPYFAVTGTHPLLPFDITEASYLLPPPDSILSTTDLIARRAVALQKRSSDLATLHSKVFHARRVAAIRFERDHAMTIKDFNFKLGDLVLRRNTKIEKALNRKMRERYTGPLIVISRNRGGAYILAELNGALFDRPCAAFRVIPYFPRAHLQLPPLEDLLDVSLARLRELEDSTFADPDDFFEEDEREPVTTDNEEDD